MLKKLRRRFVLVSRSLITLVLLLVFFSLLFFNNRQLVNSADMALERTLKFSGERNDRIPELGLPGPREPGFDVWTFCVLLDDEDQAEEVVSQADIFISEDLLADAVKQALARGDERGTLSLYGLRYLIRRDERGSRIAFADVKGMQENTYRLIGLSLGLGGLGWLALLLITIFLSRLIVRPVEQAWAQQRRFIADASHELKTPLTVILANLELLQAHRAEPLRDNLRWLESTRDEAECMRELVQDKTVRTEVQLSDTVMNCLLSFEPVAFENGVDLDSDLEPDIRVQGDAAQLRRMTTILIDNAVKYAGEDGRVFVRLGLQDGRAVLDVKNTGEKISPEDAPHVFDRFYRTDPSRNSERGGYGLGLSIAREIAEHHGAKLELLPDTEGMTVFRATFGAQSGPTAKK